MNECCMVYLDRIIRFYKKKRTCIRQLKPLFNYIFKSCEFKSQKQHVCMKLWKKLGSWEKTTWERRIKIKFANLVSKYFTSGFLDSGTDFLRVWCSLHSHPTFTGLHEKLIFWFPDPLVRILLDLYWLSRYPCILVNL